MKHLKTFEKKFNSTSIKSVLDEYKEIMNFIKPAVIKRYTQICEDESLNFGQDISDKYGGDSYYIVDNIDRMSLVDMSMHDNQYFFTLRYYEYYDTDKDDEFYVPFTKEQLDKALIEMDSDKYNL